VGVVVALQDVGPCRKELTIEVPAPAVEAETQRVTQEYSRQARLPGFRTGKVPAAVLRKRYRKEIEQEVLERLLPRYWKQAEAEKALDPLIAPEVGSVDFVEGKPLTFVATVEVRPEISVSPERNFELPDAEVLAGDAEVDEVIDQMRAQVAPWRAVEGEAVRGHRAKLRMRELGAGEGEPGVEGAATGETRDASGEAPSSAGVESSPPAPAGDEVTIEVGDPRIWDELTLAVTGMRPGQRNNFIRQEPAPPATGDETPSAPPPRRFELELLGVEERDLPPLDDELAKKLAGVDTVDLLRERVRERVLAEKRARRRRQREQALLAQLVERHPATLPQRVVDHEVRNLVEDYAGSLQRRGLDPKQAGIDWAQLASELRPQAERNVHARLVLDAVAAADQIEVTEPELEATLRMLARAEGKSALQMRRALDEAGTLPGLRRQLTRDKTIQHLLGEPIDAPAAGHEPPHHAHDHEHHDHEHHDHEHHHHHHHDATEHEHDPER
jgi:trigger factor